MPSSTNNTIKDCPAPEYRFSQRSKARLATCDPRLQQLFEEIIRIRDCTILEGRRSLARQKRLLARGRSRTLNSKHLSDPSRAVDVAPYPIDWNDIPRFIDFGRLVKAEARRLNIPIRWGGDWRTFKDYVHFEIYE